MIIVKRPRCSAIVQPGEYTIDRWDNKQRTETNPRMLMRCEYCQQLFCLLTHWGRHQECIPQ